MSDKGGGRRPPSAAAFGHLAAALAHEVRNPLNSMAIHLELIEARVRKFERDSRGDGEAITRSLSVLRQDIERVDEAMHKFLEHVGPEEARRRVAPPRDVLAAAADRMAEESRARGVRIVSACDDGDEPWLLDTSSLALALEILIANAIEASPAGAEVRISARREGDLGVFEVLDQGEGLPPSAQKQLFGLGYSTRPGHPGLGLAVAKQIIKGQGGALTLRSPGPSLGTLARIDLPLEEDP